MSWTSTPPTQEGFYWCKQEDGQTPIVVAVRNGWGYEASNQDLSFYIRDHPDYLWCGPLMPPEGWK